MSSILLSNPYVPPTTGTQYGAPVITNVPAIPPAQPADSGGGAGNAPDFAGNGGGAGEGTRAMIENARDKANDRPTKATPRSVVEAQSEPPKFGSDLPKVEMPDPIPTAPVLLALRNR